MTSVCNSAIWPKKAALFGMVYEDAAPKVWASGGLMRPN